jgi:phosphatidylserine/phosphatidylglycerophosphate/cardiolipin synthase-like enzyme/regulation of enolase protein 1 (concanavalin A-like superfamily)
MKRVCVLLLCLCGVLSAAPVHADTALCDASSENCRTRVLTLIAAERVGIDVSFWFMDDARFSNALVKQWKTGVPVRVIMDPRANASKPVNATILSQLKSAGIPMRMKSSGDIAHWKGMIFAGQNTAEFSGANYSPYEYTPQQPYVDYSDEVIYFSDEPDVVPSLMRHFDDVWTDTTGYADYANVVDPTSRLYPLYPIAPEFNFPPDDSYFDRLHPLVRAEAQRPDGKIDVTMYRITDGRDADDLIFAAGQGIPVRLYAEPNEYRNPARLDDSYNIDRMFMAGVQIRMRAHIGLNHQKTVLLYSQGVAVFGTSNWSTASDDNQLEVNYFTTKTWFLQWFHDLFDRKWDNTHVMPDGTFAAESTAFTPLPPDKPVYTAPAKQATGVDPAAATLKWTAGNWARQYDVYFGTSAVPPLLKTNVNLGPSQTPTDVKSFALPALQPGTTYYWQIVSKTMANIGATGAIWSFTTAGTAPAPTVPGTPAPADGATDVSATPTLGWSAAAATSYDVFFGSSNPPTQVATGLAAASYTPSALATNTTYFWQIVARNSTGATAGPVWSLTTGSTAATNGLPTPWVDADIGAVGVKGAASFNGSAFIVSGAGADIWNAADAFHFVYQPLNGDGEIIARVASVPTVNNWSKAGVMIRETLSQSSPFAIMLVSAAKGTAFQYRTTAGAAAAGAGASVNSAPYWVRLTRTADTISGSQSVDGVTWQPIGTTSVAMAASVFVGLAVTSHDRTRLVTSPFDHVAVTTTGGVPQPPSGPGSPSPSSGATGVSTAPTLTWSGSGATTYDVSFGTTNPPSAAASGLTDASYAPAALANSTTYFWQVTARNATGVTAGPVWSFATAAAPAPGGVPPPWSDGDVGAVGAAGSASGTGGSFTAAGAGADIWNTADAFHYVYQPFSGDGQIVAHVASVQNVASWSKAGVMIRDTLKPTSAFAFMLISAAKGAAFQYRTSAGVAAAGGAGSTATPPMWVKIVRSGATISGYQSTDGTTWQLAGTASPTMGTSVEIGLVVCSHTTGKLATAVFDTVVVTQGTAANQPPAVSLTSPANGAAFTSPADVALAASASDPENRLTRVEFYAGTTLLGTAASAPYAFTWSAAPVGTYALTAVAYDSDGGVTSSAPATVTVSAGGAPFNGIQNVFVIVLENHDWADIAGSPLAPYINNVLLPQGAHAEQYFNPAGVHPSLPNYLWLEAGQSFGVADDGSPALRHQATTQHLTRQLEAAGISWKAYEEGIAGTSCPVSDTGLYAAKHDPFVYFDDVTDGNSAQSAHCIAHVRPYAELAADLQQNTVARYSFITPDLCHDMHDCGIDAGDQWLSAEVPKILASAAYQHAVVFVTWDESESTPDRPIGMIALSPAAKAGYANTVAYTHSSTLRTVQEIFGLPDLLGDAAAAADLADLFAPAPPPAAAPKR